MRNTTLVALIFLFTSLQPTQAASYEKSLDNTEQCINFSNDTFKPLEITLEGISAVKTGEHPTKGEFSSIILVFDEALCLHGELYTAGDEPQPQSFTLSNMTHIQLILDGEEAIEQFSRGNKGKRFKVKGKVDVGYNAWHVTPILLDVANFEALARRQ